MPKRTIYVRDADTAMWDRAEAIAGNNLSAFLAAALKHYLDEQEFKEIAMQIEQHGPVTKRVLHVWGSRVDDARTAWGTSFDSDGTGPDQAAALVVRMKADPTIRNIEVEERRVYTDNWVDRRPLEQWSRTSSAADVHWTHPLLEGGPFPAGVKICVRRISPRLEAEVKAPNGEPAVYPMGVLVQSYYAPDGFESWDHWFAKTDPDGNWPWIRET
jgi:hypothetical protein